MQPKSHLPSAFGPIALTSSMAFMHSSSVCGEITRYLLIDAFAGFAAVLAASAAWALATSAIMQHVSTAETRNRFIACPPPKGWNAGRRARPELNATHLYE